MLAVGIIIAAAGYTVLYYGAELWQGEAVSIASASGFGQPPKATSSAGSSKSGTGVLGKIAEFGGPLLFFW
jgi:hypothetical protein